MMKKFFSTSIFILMTVTMFAQDIQLPQPQTKGGMPLMDALSYRQSNREFSNQTLSLQQLSDMLWAAQGINRNDGRRTSPTARNMQQIDIYVFNEKGVYLYLAEKNVLHLVINKDCRKQAVKQEFAYRSPLLLVYVANYDKMKDMNEESRSFYGATDCGFVSQNVYLYCAANKMNTVVLGMIYRDELKQLLGFNGKAILGQPVGFPK